MRGGCRMASPRQRHAIERSIYQFATSHRTLVASGCQMTIRRAWKPRYMQLVECGCARASREVTSLSRGELNRCWAGLKRAASPAVTHPNQALSRWHQRPQL